MDLEEAFWNLARETAALCRKRGKPERTFSGGANETISGWQIDVHRGHNEKTTPGSRYSGGSSRYSDRTEITWVLTADGQVWEVLAKEARWEGPEYSGVYGHDPHVESSRVLRRAGRQALVGANGKPFSEMSSKLERLPYL